MQFSDCQCTGYVLLYDCISRRSRFIPWIQFQTGLVEKRLSAILIIYLLDPCVCQYENYYFNHQTYPRQVS